MSPRIAKNDPKLAHGMAARTMEEHSATLDARVRRLMKTAKPGPFLRKCKEVYGDQIVGQHIEKLNGDRARWYVTVLDVFEGSVLFVLIAWHRGEPVIRPFAAVERHAVARMFQRSIGHADLRAVLKRLRPFVHVVMELRLMNVREGHVDLIGSGGALLGECDGGFFRFGTWVDGESASDPEIRAKCGDPETVWSRVRP